jgi:O-antigen/teichoic acid export membrane protein
LSGQHRAAKRKQPAESVEPEPVEPAEPAESAEDGQPAEAAGQSAGRRLSVITIDQMIAGASNVLIAVLAAQVLGAAAFGLFGIVFLVYVMTQGFSRALICDPLLVHTQEAEQRPGEVIGTSTLLGLTVGALIVAAGFVARLWQDDLGNAFIVLGVCMPLLMFQDLGRYLGFATAQPNRSVVLDSVWLAIQIPAVIVLLVADLRTLTWFIVAWAGSGALAGLLLFWQYRGHPIQRTIAWLRYTWSFSWRYLISYSATQGSALAGSSAVGALAGARQLGGVQGTVLFARPFGTFQIAAVAAGVAEISRSDGERHFVRRHAFKTSTFTTVVALVNGIIMLALPDKIGHAILKETWHVAKPMLLPTAVQLLALGVITGARCGLLGLRAIRRAMVIDVASTVGVLGATAIGAAINGAVGALWGVALCQGVLSVVWWTVFLSHTAHDAVLPAADSTAEPPPVLPPPSTLSGASPSPLP